MLLFAIEKASRQFEEKSSAGKHFGWIPFYITINIIPNERGNRLEGSNYLILKMWAYERGPLDIKEYIIGRSIGYPATENLLHGWWRKSGNDLQDFLKGIPEIESNIPGEVTRELNSWKASVLENKQDQTTELINNL